MSDDEFIDMLQALQEYLDINGITNGEENEIGTMYADLMNYIAELE